MVHACCMSHARRPYLAPGTSDRVIVVAGAPTASKQYTETETDQIGSKSNRQR
jgi:hypothetical protein